MQFKNICDAERNESKRKFHEYKEKHTHLLHPNTLEEEGEKRLKWLLNSICSMTPEHFFIKRAYECGAISVQAALLLLQQCLLLKASCRAASTMAGFMPAALA